MTDLKPCPFCGGEAEEITERYGEYSPVMDENFIVQCMVCLTQTAPRISKKAAIAAWNKREVKDE